MGKKVKKNQLKKAQVLIKEEVSEESDLHIEDDNVGSAEYSELENDDVGDYSDSG